VLDDGAKASVRAAIFADCKSLLAVSARPVDHHKWR
jgi:hypothetical protein